MKLQDIVGERILLSRRNDARAVREAQVGSFRSHLSCFWGLQDTRFL